MSSLPASAYVSLSSVTKGGPCSYNGPCQPLGPALSLRRTETLYSLSSSEDDDCESNSGCIQSHPTCLDLIDSAAFSPITSLNSDDTDASEYDLYERAMSFAKIRAANLGMGAAMKTLNATLEEEDPAAEERLSTVASKVIASISRCESSHASPLCTPPSKRKHPPQSLACSGAPLLLLLGSD